METFAILDVIVCGGTGERLRQVERLAARERLEETQRRSDRQQKYEGYLYKLEKQSTLI